MRITLLVMGYNASAHISTYICMSVYTHAYVYISTMG